MIYSFHSEYQEVWYRHTLPKNNFAIKSHLWHSQTNKQKTVHGNNGLYKQI